MSRDLAPLARGALIALGLLAAAAACGPGRSAPREPAPPVPVAPPGEGGEGEARRCAAAAAGLERGTRGVRHPEVSLLGPMRARCLDDGWPPAAIECFAKMTEADLGRCAALLRPKPRERLFERIGGGSRDRVAVAVALSKLAALTVGIPECDRFIARVARVLVCEHMELELRAQLGAETADLWSLPTSGLPADAQLRMADVCGRSTAQLEQRAADAGCAP